MTEQIEWGGGWGGGAVAIESPKICSVEELETLPAGTKPRTLNHRTLGEERRGTSKHSTIFPKSSRQTNIGTLSNATLGDTSER